MDLSLASFELFGPVPSAWRTPLRVWFLSALSLALGPGGPCAAGTPSADVRSPKATRGRPAPETAAAVTWASFPFWLSSSSGGI